MGDLYEMSNNSSQDNLESVPAVSAQKVFYSIDDNELLNNLDFSINEGDFVGLIGPNGAGKTTLLKAISKLLKIKSGTITINGNDLDEISAKALARSVGQVQQIAPNTHGFKGIEVVLMGRYPHLNKFQVERESDREIARTAMDFTQTLDFSERSVSTLSGGEQQRIFIARALAQQGDTLLLDEPTANLDLQHQTRIFDQVKILAKKGITILAAIHDLNVAARYCNRLILMRNGSILKDGKPEEVLTSRNIQKAFDVETAVYIDPVNHQLTIHPIAHITENAQIIKNGKRIHLISGHSSGTEIMHILHRRGMKVTVGVLNNDDVDQTTASSLGIENVSIPPFTPIDNESYHRNNRLIAEADATIMTNIPIGPSNIRNVESLRHAKHVISLNETPLETRDHTHNQATKIIASLKSISQVSNVQNVLNELDDLFSKIE
ncbi:MAG: ATP-binding cassette domain-containing protein [SAR202 cluster bacterium]|nr:ATP-binding cassette domain-containing protein [SAR202 cluster bacterium]|tara:strand:- start:2247 stop:3554 length:1308 start_codon:yes stop_codon:yes gene_type:complete